MLHNTVYINVPTCTVCVDVQCTYMCIYIYMHSNKCTPTCIYIHTCTVSEGTRWGKHWVKSIATYTLNYIHTYMYTPNYIHTYMYTPNYIHTYMYTLNYIHTLYVRPSHLHIHVVYTYLTLYLSPVFLWRWWCFWLLHKLHQVILRPPIPIVVF